LKNIGVEKNLSNVSDYLSRQGYNVHEIDTHQVNVKDFIDGFDAVVVSGIDGDIMGIQDTVAKTSIIEAKGMSPREVHKEIERRIQ
jgi:galactitol-specific phosphotransferase system IIB component